MHKGQILLEAPAVTSAEAQPASKVLSKPAVQIHRLGAKWGPVRIPDLYRVSSCFFPCSHPHVIVCWPGPDYVPCSHRLLQVQALQAAFVHSTAAAVHGARAAHSPRSPLPAPRYPCNTCSTAVPACRALPLCCDTLQIMAHVWREWGAAAETRALCKQLQWGAVQNQLYRYYQGLSIIWSVPAPLYLIKQSWLCY